MRTALRRTAPTALAIGALALTAACGGSADADDKDGNKAAAAAKSEPKPLTQAQVDRAALTLSDLPAGWAEDDSADDDSADFVADDKKCQPLVDSIGFSDSVDTEIDAEASFSKGEMGPFLTTAVGAFSAKDAKEFMTPVKVPAGCDTFTAKEEDLGKVEIAYKPASAPELGDESRGVRLTVTSLDDNEMPPMQIDAVAVRVDGAVTALAQVSIMGPDTDAFNTAIKKATTKLEKAAKSPAKGTPESDKDDDTEA